MKKLSLLLSVAFLFVACEEKMTLKEYMKEDGWLYLKDITAQSYREEYDKKDEQRYYAYDDSDDYHVFYKEVGDATMFMAVEVDYNERSIEYNHFLSNLVQRSRHIVNFESSSVFTVTSRLSDEYGWKDYNAYIKINDKKYYFNW